MPQILVSDLLSLAEAGAVIGVTRGRVWQFVNEGRLPRVASLDRYGILRTDAERFRDTPRKAGRPRATAAKR